jgi:hypothetical protein
VNKTDSAVRITHLPTGIVVQCQNERSQHKNKATALKILRARLYEKERQEKEEKLQELHNSKKEIAWGSQIRSYTLQPYRLVKDHRTKLAIGDVDRVLMGTDTHGSRAIVNDLASAYLLPVIDVGTRVGECNGVLSGLLAEVRILTPVTPCLWCRHTLDGDVIRMENLPEGERRQLVREGYSVGRVGEPEPSVIALTVLGSGLATCAMGSLGLFTVDRFPVTLF